MEKPPQQEKRKNRPRQGAIVTCFVGGEEENEIKEKKKKAGKGGRTLKGPGVCSETKEGIGTILGEHPNNTVGR